MLIFNSVWFDKPSPHCESLFILVFRGNHCTQIKPLTCHKFLTNFFTLVHFTMDENRIFNYGGDRHWTECTGRCKPKTPLPMVYQAPYPWYYDPFTHDISNPPTHGISNPLSMVYMKPSTHGILSSPIHGISNPLLISWLEMRGSVFNNGGQYTIDETWPRGQCTMEVKIPYDTGLLQVKTLQRRNSNIES